jgi:GT2 family glycosyltransferase
MTADVTIVVATRNRRDELLTTLRRHEAPVVVVDNGSSDGTQDAVAGLENVDLIALDRNHGAQARTIGARQARTPYVAFADDDSWWGPGALARAVQIFRDHPRLAMLAAEARVMPADRLDPFCRVLAGSTLGREPDLPGQSVLGFMACAAVVHRGAFLAVGGFDHIVRFPGEEERVALDLAAVGLGLAYVPGVVVFHQPSPHRDTSAERERRVLRSRVLTAGLRRPWRVVADEVVGALRGGRVGRLALRDALAELPEVARHRSVVPPPIEARMRSLAGL